MRPPLLKNRVRRKFLWVASGVAALTFVILAVRVYLKTDFSDFDAYYRAGLRMSAGNWTGVYAGQEGAAPFRYLPVVLPIVRVLAWLDWTWARELWFLIQTFFFVGSFWVLRQVAARLSRDSWVVMSVTYLLVIRFIIDGYIDGQVASVMLFGYALALRAWTLGDGGRAGGYLLIPALLKLGPFVSYLPLVSAPHAIRKKVILWAWVGTLAVGLASVLWIGWASGSLSTVIQLWKDWVQVLRMDATYFDASHYGTQSLLSASLRAFLPLGFSAQEVRDGVRMLSSAIVLGFVFLATTRRPKGVEAQVGLLGLSVYLYLFLMPQMFKYSMVMLAIPLMPLVSRLGERAYQWILGGAAIILTFSGKDLVPDEWFFWNQRASFPFWTTVALFGVSLKDFWIESQWSPWVRRVRKVLF